MTDLNLKIKKLFFSAFSTDTCSIIKLPQSGSYRQYFHIFDDKHAAIACFSSNVNENKLFIEMADTASNQDLSTPQILGHSKDYQLYLQSFAGNNDLLSIVKQNGFNSSTIQLYKDSILQLIQFQEVFKRSSKSIKKWNGQLNRTFILHDLLYFKFYFLDYLKLDYNKSDLIKDFERLSKSFSSKYESFVYRDFQARNILVQNNKVSLIDFQGAMFGPPIYDIASLLWQAQANMTEEVKETLLQYYLTNTHIDVIKSKHEYQLCVLIRIFQTLGAYGLKGLIEGKPHFKSSIVFALINLKKTLYWFEWSKSTSNLLEHITNTDFIKQFENTIKASQLKVTIKSFSYKKGIPQDESSNGGGYVFDMRGILNPGRYEPYKKLSGLDESVQVFLEEQTKMPEFLEHIKKMLSITILDYMERDFENLMINFGCTGGQHRSVYAAEKIASHIQLQYGLQTDVEHTNQMQWLK
jgi:aminoglycoside/choline kinase family phosphotransferase